MRFLVFAFFVIALLLVLSVAFLQLMGPDLAEYVTGEVGTAARDLGIGIGVGLVGAVLLALSTRAGLYTLIPGLVVLVAGLVLVWRGWQHWTNAIEAVKGAL